MATSKKKTTRTSAAAKKKAAAANKEALLTRPRTQLAAGLLEILIQDLNRMSGNWKQLSKIQQDEYIDRMRARIDELVREAVAMIVAGDYTHASVAVLEVAVKKDTTAKLLLANEVHSIIDWRGRLAVLVLADPEQFLEGLADIEGEADQRPLGV